MRPSTPLAPGPADAPTNHLSTIYRNSVDKINRISVRPPWHTADVSEINKRLRIARERAGFKSARAAAARFGWTPSTYGSHENGQTPTIKPSDAKKYGRAFKVSPAWLLTGEGTAPWFDSPLASGFAEETVTFTAPDEFDPAGLIVELERAGLVPIREVDLSAGAGGGGHMPEAYRRNDDGSWEPTDAVKARALFPHAWLALLGLDPSFTDLVRVRGDSMSPEIEDGDWVFVDRRIHRLGVDDIYLLWDGFGIVAKSLAIVRASQPPRVRILSANPKYPPDEVPIEEIMIIGRVQFRIGRIVRR